MAGMTNVCPRCGGSIPNNDNPGLYPGALSRTDNVTEVCSECGTEEAIQVMNGQLATQADWPVASTRKQS